MSQYQEFTFYIRSTCKDEGKKGITLMFQDTLRLLLVQASRDKLLEFNRRPWSWVRYVWKPDPSPKTAWGSSASSTQKIMVQVLGANQKALQPPQDGHRPAQLFRWCPRLKWTFGHTQPYPLTIKPIGYVHNHPRGQGSWSLAKYQKFDLAGDIQTFGEVGFVWDGNLSFQKIFIVWYKIVGKSV